MIAKTFAKRCLPPVVTDALSAARRVATELRDRSHPHPADQVVPWTREYDALWRRTIRHSLDDPALLDRFRRHDPLPEAYGVGIDERCVEYPWLFANLRPGFETMLDAGSTLNHDMLVNHPTIREKRLHILTLAPEKHCFWKQGISYLYGDLRNTFVRDATYDTIACLSTLEHVGCDNTTYSGSSAHQEDRPQDFVLAAAELRRMLKPGGTLLLTVPFGRYRHFGSFQQFDDAMLRTALEAFGGAASTATTYYRYGEAGWNTAEPEACRDCDYVEWITRPRSEWPTPIPMEPDRAAAARCVACVRIEIPCDRTEDR